MTGTELSALVKQAAAACKTPGKKIKSKGKGRGEARGKGEGPLGIPVGQKKDRKRKKSASYELGVQLALEDLRII